MSAAAMLVANRIIAFNEEGFRADVYDDATGLPIECKGQPTNGYGTRCRQWSRKFAAGVMTLELAEFEEPLLAHPWYTSCDVARQSAFLEIAYNQGDAGLEDGYPDLIAAARVKNWPKAATQCTVKEEALKPRYARIANILLTGVA